ncbi:hypothetical protein evm_012436 [Chilo suppressalis]|nr:hypothetical protein evm_012436 [Chilo suppressalis]
MASTSVKWFVVFALISLVSARDDNCVVATYGDLTGTPVQLPREILSTIRGITWRVDITHPCKVVGVLLNVCDNDAPPAPIVSLHSLSAAWVKRVSPERQGDATADIIVFCENSNVPVHRSMINNVWNLNNNDLWV